LNTERAPYWPFEGGRFRLVMGLLPLADGAWIEIDAGFASDLAANRRLLEERHSEVFAVLPEAAAPAAELLALLADHLPRHHPAVFRRDGDRLSNLATGESWDVARPALHPLDLAGRLVQEDFCLLLAQDGTYRLVGASLCSPARWRLADKLGLPLIGVHEPVPGYADKLAQPVDRFLQFLKPDKPVWRLNWGIVDDPAPFQPVRLPSSRPITARDAGDRLWLRVERQTLRRLAATGAVVFTVRTHITRLRLAIGSGSRAAELAATLRDMPADTGRYKQIAPFAEPLLAWLDAQGASQQ
jgi:dimethylamine monooxygenase subunit A